MNLAGSYRLWAIGVLILGLCIGINGNAATAATEVKPATIGASPSANVGATQALPATANSDQQVERRFRRARNTAVGILVLASLIGGGFALRRKLNQLRASGRAQLSFADSARLVGHLFITAVQTAIAGGRRVFMVADSAAARHPWHTRTGALIMFAVGVSLLWPHAANLDPTSSQDPVVWRFILVGAGLMLAGLVSWLCAGGLNHTAEASTAQLSSEIAAPNSGYLWATVIGLGCAIWVIGFQWLDIWNSHFDVHSWHYYAYSPMRLLFALFLAMAMIGSGSVVIGFVEKRWEPLGLDPLERLLAAFFLGASLWYVVCFLLGIVGFLNRFWVVPGFVLSVSLSLGLINKAARYSRQRLQHLLATMSIPRIVLVSIPVGTLILLGIHILVNRGLSVVGFEYDSSGHYLPYYRAVVENGGTAVNELWYHFWMTKGAGLHFVAVMLTDLQGPQLVSFVFLTAAILALILFARNLSGSLLVGLCGGVLFAAPFADQFPHFQKLHIVTLALIGGMLWLLSRSWQLGGLVRKSWLALFCLMACAAVLHTVPIAAILIPFLALTLGIYALLQYKGGHVQSWWTWAAPAAAAFLTAIGVLVLNHLVTGVMELTPFRLFWNLADQTRFSSVASPYLMLFLDEGTSASTGNAAFHSVDLARIARLLQLPFIPTALRYLAGALLIYMCMATLFDAKLRKLVDERGLLASLFIVGSAAVVSLFIGQPGSIDRFYVFALFPVVVIAVAIPGIVIGRLAQGGNYSQRFSRVASPLFVVCLLASSIQVSSTWIHSHFFWHSLSTMEAKLRFELGRESLQGALLEPQTSPQPGWPRREMSEVCAALRAEVLGEQNAQAGDKAPVKIWTMTFLQEAGCHIMPGTQVMMEISNRFGTQWHRVALGNQAVAVEELKRIEIRHLFIDLGERDETAKTGESTSIFGCLPYSPLLSADSVRVNFTVKRLYADAFLLSLKETPRVEEVPQAFTEKFAGKTGVPQLGTGDMAGICSRLRDYYSKWSEHWPVRSDSSLTKLKGWQ